MRQYGFTIIEAVLFMVVSSLLAVGIFAGATANINQQRYIDATRSFKALVQEQFVDTTRVRHAVDPDTDVICPIPIPNAAAKIGQNDSCIIIGKILSVTGGSTITIRNIIGLIVGDEDYTGTSDIAAIKSAAYDYNPGTYEFYTDPDSTVQDSPRWSTSLKLAPGTTNFNIAIIRSPSTGTPYISVFGGSVSTTFNRDTFVTNIVTTADREICVDPQGLFSLDKKSILIRKNASGPNGIELGAYTCP